MSNVAIYTCAFRVSDCCHASIWRVMEPGRQFFVCRRCNRLCEPVPEHR